MESAEKIEVRLDLRQAEEYGKFMERIGWKTIRVQSQETRAQGELRSQSGGIQVFVRRLGPVAIAKIQRPNWPLPWREIRKILKEQRVFMCKLEPVGASERQKRELAGEGFRQDGWPLLGTKTLRIDLRPSEEEIRAGFKKDCRYVLRKTREKEFQVRTDEFEKFYKIWRKSARRKNLWIPGERDYQSLIENFNKKCFCVTVEEKKREMGKAEGAEAGAVILMHKEVAYYYYAGGTAEGNKRNLPYVVVWEAIKEAKKRKCGVWDFEGVYDERWPNKGWEGFSHFKRSFGGREMWYPGCFSLWRWPL